jgi:Family of unknown function (DUF6065)
MRKPSVSQAPKTECIGAVKTPAARKAEDLSDAATAADHRIIAYQIHEDDFAPIRPAPRERRWMNNANGRFPYRCLPLVIANQYGWEILSTHHLRARWDGTSKPEGLYVENLYGDGPLYCYSHFGEGVLTFQIPFLFKTPDGWNLMVRGPTNSPKDGIAALDGIVEADWAHSTFTMNWRFTRACTVEFALGEAICLFFPIQRGALEMFRGEFRMLEADREFKNKFREWSASRDRFLAGLRKGKPEVLAQGWQKDYMQAAKDKKPLAHPFANETSWTGQRRDGNHDDSANM